MTGAPGDVEPPLRQVRAAYSAESVAVYQAYSAAIAVPALEAQSFVAPFRMERMTWIKPSFLWMMYRSGWGRKDGQEHVLRIEVRREGFDWALDHGVLSHFFPEVHGTHERWREMHQDAPVVVQWDPERRLHLEPLGHRAIQIGLRGGAVRRYTREWIVSITDVTALAREVHEQVAGGDLAAARRLLPVEQPYPASPEAVRRLAMTQ
jgi:hypothetical protein